MGENINRTRTDDNDYDPYKHRKVKKPTNYWESLAHLLKGCLGTGILAMPKGIATAGVIPGFVISVIASLMLTHCMRVLVLQEYYQAKLARVPYMAYRDAAAASLRRGPPSLRKFSKLFAISVDFFLGFYHFGVIVIYVIFMSSSLVKVFTPYKKISQVTYTLILALPCLGINMIPHLKYLAPCSMLANILTFIGLGLVLYFVLGTPAKSTNPLDLWGKPAEYPLFFGTILFALAAVGVLVAIENNMKEPQKFCPRFGVLNIGMGTVATLYIGIALIGYNYCRDKCSDVINLDMPKHSWLADTVVMLFVIAIYFSYALNAYVPIEIIYRYIERRLGPDASEKKQWTYNYIVRVIISILSLILAGAIPKISLFISLFGSFCLSAMGVIFPMLMEALTRPSRFTFIKDVVFMIVGVGVMFSGGFVAMEGLIRELTRTDQPVEED